MYSTSEPSTTTQAQVQHDITTDESGSSSTVTIALSIGVSCVAGVAILLIAVLIMVRKEDSALPYRNRLQTIKDASPSPSDYEYEEVDGYLQGEDNTCCTVPNVEHEYTGLCRATLERDAGGYMALRVSDENASGNLAPSVTGEISEDYMLMGPIVRNVESDEAKVT